MNQPASGQPAPSQPASRQPVPGVSPAPPAEDRALDFRETLSAEYQHIHSRRKKAGVRDDGTWSQQTDRPKDLVGIALSGGGIRSATFSLGLLQGLKKTLKHFDYLSTVSGGGFTGGWWSAWLSRPERTAGDIFPEHEHTMLTRSEFRHSNKAVPDGSIDAGRDPIHHLRLFSNYLTPVRGALSGDTWRAIAFITRNMILNWIILLCVLFAAVLVAQSYFTAIPNPSRSFLYPYELRETDIAMRDSVKEVVGRSRLVFQEIQEARGPEWRDSTSAVRRDMSTVRGPDRRWNTRDTALFNEHHIRGLKQRLIFSLWPSVFLIGLLSLLAWFWLQNHGSRTRHVYLKSAYAVVIGGLVVAAGVMFLPSLMYPARLAVNYVTSLYLYHLIAFGGLWLIAAIAILAHIMRRDDESGLDLVEGKDRVLSAELIRNRTTRWAAQIGVLNAVLTVLLVFSGMGHEVINFLISQSNSDSSEWTQYVVKSGGYLAVLASLAGAIYTGAKASPSGGGDINAMQPSKLRSSVISFTPPAVLVLLLCYFSWLGFNSLTHLLLWPRTIVVMEVLALGGIAISFFHAGYEIQWKPAYRQEMRGVIGVVSLIIAIGAVSLAPLFRRQYAEQGLFYAAIGVSVLSALVILHRWWTYLKDDEFEQTPPPTSGTVGRIFLALLLGLSGVFVYVVMPEMNGLVEPPKYPVMLALGAVLFTIGIAERKYGEGNNLPAMSLLFLLSLCLTALVLTRVEPQFVANIPVDQRPELLQDQMLAIIASMASLALTIVVIVGWVADPNALSLHQFYKARLVRAYLGASNSERVKSEISETHAKDDVKLSELANTELGGPYHIVNTTLNLVAAKDLASVQRKADYFTLTQDFCGSTSTGFRPTRDYMSGRMTLGTAVAISGAAVSPNMGSKSGSGALAMLLTLFNVRIGYWAANPGKGRWRRDQPRLWPYYALREFLSQTTKLSSFCYLTDGGHFDNTGLYSLFQRGCKYVMVSDNGADPKPCFADLGEALRRSRIDFGVEFSELDLECFVKNERDRCKSHFSVCTFTYGDEHAKKIGLAEDQKEGILVIFKPGIIGDEPSDIIQYDLQNPEFPQQSTAQQWYGEDQFESYRKLGEWTAASTLNRIEPARFNRPKDLFEALLGASQPPVEAKPKHHRSFFEAAGGTPEVI